MKYAQIDSNNQIIGWFDRLIHDTIPDGCVELSDEKWLSAINNGHNCILENGDTCIKDFYSYHEDVELAKAKQYLIDTDWYVIRKIETGKEIPEDILQKRSSARDIL